MKPRDSTLDVAKGIGILLMIIGHLFEVPPSIKKVIYSFHMPMFFIISGLLYSAKNETLSAKEFTKKKALRLYLPIIKFGTIFSLLSIPFLEIESITEYFYMWGRMLLTISPASLNFNTTPFWFLTCLLFCEAYFYIIKKSSPPKLQLLVVLSIALIGFSFNELQKAIPFNAITALTCLLFYYIGYTLKNSNTFKSDNNLLIKLTIAFVLLIVTTKISPTRLNLVYGTYPPFLLMITAALSGFFITYTIARKLKNMALLSFIGKNSIIFLAWNYWIRFFVQRYIGTSTNPQLWILDFAIQTTLLLLICYISQVAAPKAIKKFYDKGNHSCA